MNKRKTISILVVIVACLTCVMLVFKLSRLYEQGIAENCYKNIEIEEQMFFDEPEIIEQYGEPIEIVAGTRGTISDSIASSGDINGYEYIDASLLLDNGKHIRVAITFDNESQKSVCKATDILPHSTDKYIIVFDIGKIKSSQSILEEYVQSRERYYSRVKNVRAVGVIISFMLTAIICGVFCITSKHKTKTE